MSYDYSLIRDEFKDVAYYYAKDVVDGKIVADRKVVKACLRHLNDIKKIDDPNSAYTYIPEKAQNTIDSIEMLPDVKTRKTYPLARFQKFIISSLYGWRKKVDHSVRRFRKDLV